MKRNNKGFTLIELLAVIVILGIILTIATTNVIKNINDSKAKSKYIAAKEIVQMSEAYFATNGSKTSVKISELSAYLESDATNPATGANDLTSSGAGQIICRDITQKDVDNSYASNSDKRTYSNQTGNEPLLDSDGNPIGYEFDGYWYGFDGTCKQNKNT